MWTDRNKGISREEISVKVINPNKTCALGFIDTSPGGELERKTIPWESCEVVEKSKAGNDDVTAQRMNTPLTTSFNATATTTGKLATLAVNFSVNVNA